MQLTNTEDGYGLAAKGFHWIIAVLILGLLPMGLMMGGLENSPFKFQIYGLHKSFGLTVLFLGIARIVWRFVSPPPDHLETHAHWEVTLAGAAHFWLYVCIIGIPLSGWLMSSAGEFPVPFFGFQMPYLVGKDEGMAGLYARAHEVLAYTLLFVLALHIAGALKHHVIDRDLTLQRMTFNRPGLLLPALVVLVAGASYAVSAIGLFKDLARDRGVQQNTATDAPSAAVDTSALPENGWAIVREQSRLTFTTIVYNAPVTGEFNDFSGTIIFDPDDLSTAVADIRIGMKDVKTGDEGRDSTMQGPEWFDTASFPEAHFTTQKFEAGADGTYVAIGELTMRDVTLPLILPFALEIKGDKAHMTGKISLDRVQFNVGKGAWEDGKTVARNVDIAVEIMATR